MTFSAIIPTYNEAENIGPLVCALRKYGGSQLLEILVVDGGSTDGTADAARRAGARVHHSSRQGRAAQMNMGASLATGEILYFVHADVQIHPSFVRDIEQAVRQGNKAGCYRFQFDSDKPMLRVNSYGTRFEGIMSRGGDQTLFITHLLFDQLKGFDEAYVVMEDFEIIQRIRKVARFAIIPKAVLVSARKYERNSWLRVQVANLTAFSLFFLRVSPVKIASTYRKMLK